MIITKEVKKSRNVAAALRVASRARRVKRDSFNGKRESAGTRRGTRGESCRFEIRRVMGEKQKKKKDEQFPIPFRLLFEICAPFERGEDIDERFFSSCNLFGGKNRGKGGEKRIVGVLGKRRSTNRVAGNTQIRNSVPLVIFRGTLENVRAKDFPGKPLICILIEEIITFTGVWPIYKVNRLTPSAP